jgi:hypothetical protein
MRLVRKGRARAPTVPATKLAGCVLRSRRKDMQPIRSLPRVHEHRASAALGRILPQLERDIPCAADPAILTRACFCSVSHIDTSPPFDYTLARARTHAGRAATEYL